MMQAINTTVQIVDVVARRTIQKLDRTSKALDSETASNKLKNSSTKKLVN